MADDPSDIVMSSAEHPPPAFEDLSLSETSNALQGTKLLQSIGSTGSFSFTPAKAAPIAEPGFGTEPMAEETVEEDFPSSSAPPHDPSSHNSSSSRLPRLNSFDSTTATLGSPRPSSSFFPGDDYFSSPYRAPPPVRLQSLVAMRHSERLDAVDQLWAARSPRPWDTPITERGKGLAFEAGGRIRAQGWGVTRVVVSPFLRCVQTAAEVVRALTAVDTGFAGRSDGSDMDATRVKVSIDYGLMEMMNSNAIRCFPPSTKTLDFKSLLWVQPNAELEKLFPDGSLDSNYIPSRNELVEFGETDEEANQRFSSTFDAIANLYPEDSILCVTHGAAVAHSISRLVPVTVYDVDYCAYSCAQRPLFAQEEDGEDDDCSKPGGGWELLTESGPSGINWLD